MSGVFLTGINEVVAEMQTESLEAPHRARTIIQTYSARIRGTARAFAPRDEGTMARSISYSSKLVPGGAVGEIGPTARRDGFPYPAAVEWGTSKMAPQAFMGPALDRHSAEFAKEIAQVPFSGGLRTVMLRGPAKDIYSDWDPS